MANDASNQVDPAQFAIEFQVAASDCTDDSKGLLNSLSKMKELAANWDGYGAPPPNDVAWDRALAAVKMLLPLGLSATAVPSAEGGIGFAFRNDQRYASLEFCNDGDIVAIWEVDGQRPVALDVPPNLKSIETTLRDVRKFLEHGAGLPADSGSQTDPGV